MKKKHTGAKLAAAAVLLAAAAVTLQRLAKSTEEPDDTDCGNPYLSAPAQPEPVLQGSLEENTADAAGPNFYETHIKKALDKALSFIGLVTLSPLFCLISIAIMADDPGHVIFVQKRVGKDKHFFYIHKFRSMKVTAPAEVSAGEIADCDQYYTRTGRFLRRTCLDELPQLWDIFRGKMSFVGPRPVLWNTFGLIAERDKYGANNVLPGLTGLAQINGKDRLCDQEKARWDGIYVKTLRKGPLEGFSADVRCAADTVGAMIREFDRQQE